MDTNIIADVLSIKDPEIRRGLIATLLPKAASQAQQLLSGQLKSASIPIRDLGAVLGCLDENEAHEVTRNDTRKSTQAIITQMFASSEEMLMQEIASIVKKIPPSDRSSWRYDYYGRYPRQLQDICEDQWEKVARGAQKFLQNGDASSALTVDWLCAMWLTAGYGAEDGGATEKIWRDCWRQLWCNPKSALPSHKAVSLGTYLRRGNGLGWLAEQKLSKVAGENLAGEVGRGSDLIRKGETIVLDAHCRRAVVTTLMEEYVPPLLGMVALIALPESTLDQEVVDAAVVSVAEGGWECAFSPLKDIPKSRWRKIRNALTAILEDEPNRESLLDLALYHEKGCACGSVAAEHLPESWLGDYMWGPSLSQWLSGVDETTRREHLQSAERERVREVFLDLNDNAQSDAASYCPGLAASFSRGRERELRSWLWQWLYRHLGDDRSAMMVALSLIENDDLTIRELVATSRACVAEVTS